MPGRRKQPALDTTSSMEPALGCNCSCSFVLKVDKLWMLVQYKVQKP